VSWCRGVVVSWCRGVVVPERAGASQLPVMVVDGGCHGGVRQTGA
jgi:hypothetical protein